ncbi:MAG: TIGR00730 family Rossman fold protein [Cyclobacteriaceae bacterium]
MKKVCVFCGSSTGYNGNYGKLARKLAEELVVAGCELVYGGGSVGLMGILADEVLLRGGKVTGVIPGFLHKLEVGHHGLSELIITESMHERKQTMAALSDGFIAMPGGIGTLEELFEIFTWSQLDLVKHPVAILNTEGYYDALITFLDKVVAEGFLKQQTRNALLVESDPAKLLKLMRIFKTDSQDDWQDKV